MKVSSGIAALAAFATVVSAVSPPAGHKYIRPGAGDVRAPCPGLNSLANHGFLPRSGKNISVADFIKGGKDGLNMGADFMSSIGILGLQAAGPNATTVNLNQLRRHNFPIEHDASLSRQDKYFGQNLRLHRRPEFRMWWSYFNTTIADIPTASAARFARVNDSLQRNPDVTYGPRELILSYGETSLWLQTMGQSPIKGKAPVPYVHSLFVKERLPYELGWTPSALPITLASLGAMSARLQNATPDPGDEAIYVVTKGSLADLLAGTMVLNSTSEQ